MTALAIKPGQITEELLLSLAKEIATDIFPLETILKNHNIGQKAYETICKLPRFQLVLEEAVRAWSTALSTADRVKLKAIVQIEESLPEFHERIHDSKEPLNHKVELLKALTRLAGIGGVAGFDGAPGEKISITINMGADKELRIDALPARVIDGSAVEFT